MVGTEVAASLFSLSKMDSQLVGGTLSSMGGMSPPFNVCEAHAFVDVVRMNRLILGTWIHEFTRTTAVVAEGVMFLFLRI